MDRADVIIFGGGMVGLALASALDSSGLSAIVVDPADPAPRSDRQVRRPHQRGVVELDADAPDDRRRRPSPRARLPDPADLGRRRARARRAPFRSRRRRAARLDAREPPPARRAAGPRRGRRATPGCCGSRESPRSTAAIIGVVVALDDGRKLSAPLLVAADGRNSPMREAGRRSASRAGATIIRRSSRCSATSGRTRMSPMRFSIRPGRSRCCR